MVIEGDIVIFKIELYDFVVCCVVVVGVDLNYVIDLVDVLFIVDY